MCDRLSLLGMLVENMWYRLMQIITYLPSSSWLQLGLLVLVSATCDNGFKCDLQKGLD